MPFIILLAALLLSGCEGEAWNDPYPNTDPTSNTLFMPFTERPKHLDPARSYSAAEWPLICQIYEPPLQYHYLKRPYVLEPLTAAKLPSISYFDAKGRKLKDNTSAAAIAYSEYEIHIKPGIMYQNHPAFAVDADGKPLYLNLSLKEAESYHVLSDFKSTGTRELIADDYVYQIKRLADPVVSSPIYGLMSAHIVGLTELRTALSAAGLQNHEQDLRDVSFEGAKVVDRYTYRIRIKGKYPQFQYWLAMPFFSPMPWEAALFFAQPGLNEHNISLDWYPVGTGPFMMGENNPERRMTLLKNTNYREEFYPSVGEQKDIDLGLLENAGQTLPLLDQVIFTLEREDISFWNKFLQGYYDISPISADNFTYAIQFKEGLPGLTSPLKAKNIRLRTSVATDMFYWGFNMLDDNVGGYSQTARKLRQAISLGFDKAEFLSIFLNGRGVIATGPLPPDIYGASAQPNLETQKVDIEKAKALLKEAGFKEGFTIYLDTVVSGEPNEIAMHTWLIRQFKNMGLTLVIRGTDYNRFQDKIKQGNVQMYFLGWNADYPDPENFFFLLYGPNGSAKYSGENWSNYNNPEYDRLFENMRTQANGPERLKTIASMLKLLQNDTPWIFGFYPKSFALYHDWLQPSKPSSLVHNNLKYIKVNPALRAKQRLLWNQPVLLPLFILLGLLILGGVILFKRYRRQESQLKERK